MSNSHESIEDGKMEETTSNDTKADVLNEVVEASSTTGANQLDEAAPDSKLKTDETGATLVKTSQRKLRLNRRGFHLAALETKDAAEKDINGNNRKLMEVMEKNKTEQPKKVISLRSVKRNLPEQTLAPPKKKIEKITFGSDKKEEKASSKTESRETSEISSSKDLPVPKKHKLITWP